jgi:hypothetical protein
MVVSEAEESSLFAFSHADLNHPRALEFSRICSNQSCTFYETIELDGSPNCYQNQHHPNE